MYHCMNHGCNVCFESGEMLISIRTLIQITEYPKSNLKSKYGV